VRAGPPVALLAMLFTMVVWGFSPVFIHSLSVGLGPADALVIRYAISAAFFLLAMVLWRPPQIARQDWPRLALICLAMFGYNLGSVYGFERIGAGVGGLIIGTQPLLIVLLAAGLGIERITGSILIGLALALIGTVALFWSDFQGEIGSGVSKLGALFVFLAGVSWAIYTVAVRPLVGRYGAWQISALSIIGASVPMAALASPHTIDVALAMTMRQWLEMLFMIVMGTLVSAATWNFAAVRMPPAVAGIFLYLIPVIAVAAGAAMLGEEVNAQILVGGALILSGVAVAQYGGRWRRGREWGGEVGSRQRQ
jgi:drug/metabolite transporter (DMT)-like permease